MEHSSWENRDIDDLEARKNCLNYLNKLGRKLRGQTSPSTGMASGTVHQMNGVINETFEEDGIKLASDEEP